MNNKTVILIRSVSGAGKTTLAYILANHYYPQDPRSVVCSADDYQGYWVNNKYIWTPETCKLAHKYCHDKFLSLLQNDTPVVIVDNTNLTEKAMYFYKFNATGHGYEIQVISIEPQKYMLEQYAERNTHGVGIGKIKQMYETYLQNK